MTKISTTPKAANTPASGTSDLQHVHLDTPITRGETQITELTLRKPKAGELRGVSISDLFNIDTGAVLKLIPRVTSPSLTQAEAEGLDLSDFSKIAIRMTAFLLPKTAQDQAVELGLN